MIVGINYNTDGSRYIAKIDYISKRENFMQRKIANIMKIEFDEVYIVDVNNTDMAFIKEIITNGCRM